MKQVRAGLKRWRDLGRDTSEVEKRIQGIQSLMTENKLEEVERILDQALEMLGETDAAPDVYGQE